MNIHSDKIEREKDDAFLGVENKNQIFIVRMRQFNNSLLPLIIKFNLSTTPNFNFIILTPVLSFPKGYFIKNKQRPLSTLMIKTLELAYKKQKNGLLFGPKDIKGSVIPLIQRGLLNSRTIKRNGKFQLTWYVTPQAIDMLKSIAPKVDFHNQIDKTA